MVAKPTETCILGSMMTTEQAMIDTFGNLDLGTHFHDMEEGEAFYKVSNTQAVMARECNEEYPVQYRFLPDEEVEVLQ